MESNAHVLAERGRNDLQKRAPGGIREIHSSSSTHALFCQGVSRSPVEVWKTCSRDMSTLVDQRAL